MRALRITQKELARRLGLSYATVSRALNGDVRVRPETRRRVLDGADAHGFRGSAVARALRLKRSLALGVVWSDGEGSYWSTALAAMAGRARDRGYHIVVALRAPDEPSSEALEFLCARQVDAVILSPSSQCDPQLEIAALHACSCPVLLFNSRLPEYDGPYLGTSSREGSRRMTRYLLELGHRDIVFAAGPAGEYTAAERLAGYHRAMSEAGLAGRIEVVKGGFTRDDGVAAARRILQLPRRPTAIQAVNDPLAIGIHQEMRRRGLQAPGDFSLAGYSDDAACELLPAPLTTVAQPAEQLGRRAVDLAVSLVEDGSLFVSEELDDRLVIRNSTAPLRLYQD